MPKRLGRSKGIMLANRKESFVRTIEVTTRLGYPQNPTKGPFVRARQDVSVSWVDVGEEDPDRLQSRRHYLTHYHHEDDNELRDRAIYSYYSYFLSGRLRQHTLGREKALVGNIQYTVALR